MGHNVTIFAKNLASFRIAFYLNIIYNEIFTHYINIYIYTIFEDLSITRTVDLVPIATRTIPFQ